MGHGTGAGVRLAIALLIGGLGVYSVAAGSGPPDGAAVFRSRCAKCHGETGRTDTPGARALKVRPLANDPRLAQMAPADILQAVKLNPKHGAIAAVAGLDDGELGAAALFVKELAKLPTSRGKGKA